MPEFMEDVERKGLCDHEQWTVGCDACRFVDYGYQCREILILHRKCENDIESAKSRLADQALTPAQRKRIEEALETATQQGESWDRLLEGLYELFEPYAEAVNKVKENKPEMWAKKFQELADVNAAELDRIFHTVYPDRSAGKFRAEDRSHGPANIESSEPHPPKAASNQDPEKGPPKQKTKAGLNDWSTEMKNAWMASDLGTPRGSDREKRNEMIADKLRAATAKLHIDDKSLGFGSPAPFNSRLILQEDLQALHMDAEAEAEARK